MATWEDGPEYAPVLRPDHFAEPAAPPLSAAPPAEPSGPPAPIERPGFDQPQAVVAPLETLIPPVEDARDPSVPFAVVSASLTEATSAWSATHWSPPTGPAVSGPALASPSLPFPPPPPPAPAASGPFPAPGTAQWFQPAPPPYAPTPVPSGPGAIAEAFTWGVLICLVLGGIVWPLAPVALLIAFALASRVKAGRTPVLSLFTAAVSVLVVVGVVAGLLSDGFFSDWWELVARWAQVLCWATVVAGWVLVWRALRASTRPGPTPTVWG